MSGFPPNNVNVYVLGDVLIDAGLALDRRRIMRQIDGRTITANALTHAHFEHHGSSHASCEQLGIRCGAEQTMSRPSEAGKMVFRGPHGACGESESGRPCAQGR